MVGAGPYGLSVAAHLRHAGIAAHVFGEPMAFWRNNMPRGMLMRSPWRATHFSDPDGAWSLDAYAAAHGVDPNQQLPLDTFSRTANGSSSMPSRKSTAARCGGSMRRAMAFA